MTLRLNSKQPRKGAFIPCGEQSFPHPQIPPSPSFGQWSHKKCYKGDQGWEQNRKTTRPSLLLEKHVKSNISLGSSNYGSAEECWQMKVKQIFSSTFQKVLLLKSHGGRKLTTSSFGRVLKIVLSRLAYSPLSPSGSLFLHSHYSLTLRSSPWKQRTHRPPCEHLAQSWQWCGITLSLPASLLTGLGAFFILHPHHFLAVHPLLPLCSNALHVPHLCQLQTSSLRTGTLLDVSLGPPHQQGADYIKSLGCRHFSSQKPPRLSISSRIFTWVNMVLMLIYPSPHHERQF